MTMYVYGTDGEPQGFLFENFIYGLEGAPLGRIIGSRVHRLDGSYAGEWLNQMVVRRPSARAARPIFAVSPPPSRPAIRYAPARRVAAEYRLYEDAFELLRMPTGADDESWAQAAE